MVVSTLELQFAESGRNGSRIRVTVCPNGEIKLASATANPHVSDRIVRELQKALQLVFLENDPDPHEFSEFDFGSKDNTLLSFISILRKQLASIADGILAGDRRSHADIATLQEWAWLLDSSTSLTVEEISQLPLFQRLCTVFYGDARLEDLDRIKLFDTLLNDDHVIRSVRIRLCERLGSISSAECLLLLAKVCHHYLLGPSARTHCSRLLLQFQQDEDFHRILATLVIELRKMRPYAFQEMFQGTSKGIATALRSIAHDHSAQFSFEQRICSALLLTRLVGNEADHEMIDLYKHSDVAGRDDMIQQFLLEELVDWEVDSKMDSQIVCRQIIGCLAHSDAESSRDVLEVIVVSGYDELISRIHPELLHGIDLEALAKEKARLSKPASSESLGLLAPSQMLPPPVQKKLRVL
ncbi:hypothetical protein SH501x_003210 [Pirellulaceae bacterium SH501]